MIVASVVRGMPTNETIRHRDSAGESERRFVAVCDDCSFEDGPFGVDEARAAAADHGEETEHDVVALEVPAVH